MLAPTAVANPPAAVLSPAPSGSTPAEGREPGAFARLLDGAAAETQKPPATRATTANKVAAGKERQKGVDKAEASTQASTKQAGPADMPTECPAGEPSSAPATDEDTAPVAGDPAALLATLPPLPARPFPAGQGGPVRSGNAGGAGGVRSAADDKDPLQAAPDLGDTRDTRNAARGGNGISAGAAFAETLRDTRTAAAESRTAAAETAPALPLPMQAAVATGVSASAPAEARIAATPGSADFATQLGVQLSTFVREGIQHARLELHPTELGPVTVQIQLDGNAAQVNLSAEQAPTRAALEQALPQLAGSLREAGLTLTGGGVFEQPRQQQAEGRGDGSTRDGGTPRSERDSAGRESVTTQPLAAPRRRGVVDLVA